MYISDEKKRITSKTVQNFKKDKLGLLENANTT